MKLAKMTRGAMSATILFLLISCQPSPPNPAPPPAPAAVNPDLNNPPPAQTGSHYTATVSEMRLDDIGEAIMNYFALNRRLPPTLNEVATAAEPGQQLNFISPVSGQLYVYDPTGLAAPGVAKKIILYDPAPGPDGARWCLVMGVSTSGSLNEVVAKEFPEASFKLYAPTAPPAPPVAPDAQDSPAPPGPAGP